MTTNVKMCLNAVLPPEKLPEASVAALRENPNNAPNGAVLLDAITSGFVPHASASMGGLVGGPSAPPLAAMLYTQKKWRPGRTLKVAFFDTALASKRLRGRIREKFEELEDVFNLRYEWLGFRVEDADVRINVDSSGGSWSYLGTDVLSIARDRPTMNFGWFDEGTDEEELNRTVKHEAIHNAACGHEHQNPKAGLKWNVPAVLRHYGGPPNNWSEQDVYHQVINPAKADQIAGTRRDPESIMHYAVPAELLLDPSQAVGWNSSLSKLDRKFLRDMYPFASDDQEAA